MQIIETNSPEHRALVIEAINNKDVHTLRQLKGISESSELIIIGSFLDALMYSSCDTVEKRHELITSKMLYNFLNDE